MGAIQEESPISRFKGETVRAPAYRRELHTIVNAGA